MKFYIQKIVVFIALLPVLAWSAGRVETAAVTEVSSNKNGLGLIKFDVNLVVM